MEIKKDILGNTPKVGDTIVFNPTGYKGLMSGVVAGFAKSGMPEVKPERVYDNNSDYGKLNKNGMYTPKTGFVVAEVTSEEETESKASEETENELSEDTETGLEVGATYNFDKYGSIGIFRGYDEDGDPCFEVTVNNRGYHTGPNGYCPFFKEEVRDCVKIS